MFSRVSVCSLLLIVALPGFALGSTGVDMTYVLDGIDETGTVISYLVPLLVAIALVVFIWGAIVFITRSDDEKARSEGRTKMIWGIIALFVIVSVWGLVALVNQITGIERDPETYAPQSIF